MSATSSIFKRELRSYFASPLAYVFLCLFLISAAFAAFPQVFFEENQASLGRMFQALPILFIVFAPALAMRMWAEERRTGSVELLFTLPVTVSQGIVGKFFAGWMFFLISLAATAPIVFAVTYLGDPEWGPIISGYVGAALMAAAFLAIGMFFSALTKNNVIAYVLAVAVCYLFVMIGRPDWLNAISTIMPQSIVRIFEANSFMTHYDAVQRGVIELRNLFFMIVMTVAFLFCSGIILDNRKAQ